MAAGATYEPIATQTLASAASSITFSSIAASWTDLRLVLVASQTTAGQYLKMTYNGDTATNYSRTTLVGSGTAASSTNTPNTAYLPLGDIEVVGSSTTIPFMSTMDIFSYAGSTYKTELATISADQNGSGAVLRQVGLWRSTSAITSITITSSSGNMSIGTTATLYGIKAA